MSRLSITSLDDFQKGMGIRSTAFEFDSQSSEQQDLYSGPAGIPSRQSDTGRAGQGVYLPERPAVAESQLIVFKTISQTG